MNVKSIELELMMIGLGLLGMVMFQNLEMSKQEKINKAQMVAVSDSLETLQMENEKLRNNFLSFYMTNSYTAHATFYNGLPGQTDDTPNITADGSVFEPKFATRYRWVALSRDLLKRFNPDAPFEYGDFVFIKGLRYSDMDGIYRVRDTMNKRYGVDGAEGVSRIDILISIGEEKYYAWQTQGVSIYKIHMIDEFDYASLVE